MAAAIIALIGTLIATAYKVWRDHRSYTALQAKLTVTERALERAHQAGEERGAREAVLEESIREHLKNCKSPLADWANELLGRPKPTNDPST